MRVPLSWLAEHVGGDLPTVEETADAFVRVGFEIEELIEPAEITGPLVVGLVREIEELTGLDARWDKGTNLNHGLLLANRFFRKHPNA